MHDDYKKWLKLQIEFLRSDEWRNQDDDLPAILDEARQRAVDLGLVDALEALNNESLLTGMVGALVSMKPQSAMLTPEQAAAYVGTSKTRIMSWIDSGELLVSNISDCAKPIWKIKKSDIDQLLKNRQPETKRVKKMHPSNKRY